MATMCAIYIAFIVAPFTITFGAFVCRMGWRSMYAEAIQDETDPAARAALMTMRDAHIEMLSCMFWIAMVAWVATGLAFALAYVLHPATWQTEFFNYFMVAFAIMVIAKLFFVPRLVASYRQYKAGV